MGRPGIKQWYVDLIRTYAHQGETAYAIAKKLKADAAKAKRTDDVPVERTVRREMRKFDQLSPEKRKEYALFYWPDSIEGTDNGIPWEASSTLLSLLRYLHMRKLNRPSIGFAKLYWRAYQAMQRHVGTPYAVPMHEVLRVVLALAVADGEGESDKATKAKRATEWYVAYAPWRSEPERAEYDARVSNGALPDFRGYSDTLLRQLGVTPTDAADIPTEDIHALVTNTEAEIRRSEDRWARQKKRAELERERAEVDARIDAQIRAESRGVTYTYVPPEGEALRELRQKRRRLTEEIQATHEERPPTSQEKKEG